MRSRFCNNRECRAILINGKSSKQISVLDRGLQYGDGLFETIAVLNGRLLLWEEHIERLKQGCTRLQMPQPDEAVLFEEANAALIGARREVLKIILTRGEGPRGYRLPEKVKPTRICYATQWPDYPASYLQTGVKLRLCSNRLSRNRRLAGVKHLNRLENVMARAEWSDKEIVEGLMCDDKGRVIEGTTTNLFLVKNGRLLTPDLGESGVRGVMRQAVMRIAEALAIPCSEREVTLPELSYADEVFVTNSLIGVWPVVHIDSYHYPGSVAPEGICQGLIGEVQERVFKE